MRQTEGTKLSLQGDPQRYDVDTFLTILYVPVDDFGKSHPSSRPSDSALDERGDYPGPLQPMALISERTRLLSLCRAPPALRLSNVACPQSVQSFAALPRRRHCGFNSGGPIAGPNACDGGWRPCARSLKRCMIGCWRSFGSNTSAPCAQWHAGTVGGQSGTAQLRLLAQPLDGATSAGRRWLD